MENMQIYNAVKEVPDNAKKRINGGRLNGKTDINPMWRIKILTEQFGPCGIGWYYTVKNHWTESYGEEVSAFVEIELFIKVDGEWSQPIYGIGGNMFAEKEKSGIHVSDECFKMATTDAISVACKQLGIGADVYWDADRTKYDSGQKKTETPRTEKPAQQTRRQEDKPDIGQQEDKPEDGKAPVMEALVTKAMVNHIEKEVERTGIEPGILLNMFQVSTYNELTVSQYQVVMKKFSKTKSREPA